MTDKSDINADKSGINNEDSIFNNENNKAEKEGNKINNICISHINGKNHTLTVILFIFIHICLFNL
jgi:hypothetical protein